MSSIGAGLQPSPTFFCIRRCNFRCARNPQTGHKPFHRRSVIYSVKPVKGGINVHLNKAIKANQAKQYREVIE